MIKIFAVILLLSAFTLFCKSINPKVTFVELGSVNCTPCQKMKDIMDKLEKKYPDELKIVFYDVKTSKGRADSEKYRIRLIPTQVFLDSTGREFFRHEGYWPLKNIDSLLLKRGLTPKNR